MTPSVDQRTNSKIPGPGIVLLLSYLNSSLLLTWIVGFVIPPDSPHLDTNFVKEIEANPSFWPTRELRDAIVFGLGLLLVLIFTTAALRSNFSWSGRRSFVVLSYLILGIQIIVAIGQLDTRLRNLNPGFYFEGFTPRTIGLAAMIALVVLLMSRSHAALQKVTLAVIALSLFPVFLSLFQFPLNNLDSTNSQFVYNELLAVTAGRLPLVDFSPQYSSGLAYLVALTGFIGLDDPLVAVGMSVTVLNLVVVTSLVLVVVKIEDSRVLRWFYAATIASSTVFTTTRNGSLSSYFQAMPVRALVFSTMLAVVCGLARSKCEPHIVKVVGLSAPVLFLLNFEFGVSAFVALLSVAVFLDSGIVSKGRIASSICWACAPLFTLQFGLAMYRWLNDSICGATCGLEFVVAFGGKGFFAVPMPDHGLHLVMLASFGAGVITSFLLRRVHADWKKSDLRVLLPLMLATSIYGLAGFQYFVGRSYAANLPPLFLPWIMLLTCFAVVVKRTESFRPVSRMMLSAILMTGCSLSLLHRPPLDVTATNLISPGPSTNFSELTKWPTLEEEVKRIVEVNGVSRDRVAVISRGMMVDAIRAKIQVGLPYNSPSSLALDSQLEFSCEDLRHRDVDFVVVASGAISPSLIAVLSCGGFSEVSEFDDGSTFRRTTP